MEMISIKDSREFEVMTMDSEMVTLCGVLIGVDTKIDHTHNPIYRAIMERLDDISKKMFTDYIEYNFGGNKRQFEISLQHKDIRIEMKRWYRIVELDTELVIYRKCSLESNKIVQICTSRTRQVYMNLLHDFEVKVNPRATKGLPPNKLGNAVKDIVCDPDCIIRIDPKISKYTNDRTEYTNCFWDLEGYLHGHARDHTPAWDSFLSSFNLQIERDLFMAFVYSIFKSDDRGRQIIWVKGKGKSGKTTVYNVISEVLSDVNPELVTAIPDRAQIDKFTYGNADKWRLAVISNCVDQLLLKNNDIIKLTGGDRSSIRKMYSDAKITEIHCKFLVASNFAPMVEEVDHEMSRIIYLQMDDESTSFAFARWSREHSDKIWRDHLLAEFPALLAKGKEVYYRRGFRTPEGNFSVPEELFDKLRKIHDNDVSRKMLWFLQRCCEMNMAERGITIYQLLREFSIWSGLQMNSLLGMVTIVRKLATSLNIGWNYTNIKHKNVLIFQGLFVKEDKPGFEVWEQEFVKQKSNEEK